MIVFRSGGYDLLVVVTGEGIEHVAYFIFLGAFMHETGRMIRKVSCRVREGEKVGNPCMESRNMTEESEYLKVNWN